MRTTGHNGAVIIDCVVYRDGRRVDDGSHRHDLLAACSALHDERDFIWPRLYEPTAAEMTDVARILGLHPLAVEDAVKAHQRPKLERYGDWLLGSSRH